MLSLNEESKQHYFVFTITERTLLGKDDSEIDHLLYHARRLSQEWQQPQTIALVQGGEMRGYTREFYTQVAESLLRYEFEKRIVKIRLLLRLIRTSPSFWIYVSCDECLGPYAELAMSCHYHYCTSHFLRFGFPEILAGIFPYCGVFESRFRNNGKLQEEWKQRPIRKIQKGDPSLAVTFIPGEDPVDTLQLLQPQLAKKFSISSKADKLCAWYEKWLKDHLEDSHQTMVTKDHWQDSVQFIRKQENRTAVAQWFIQATASYVFTKSFTTSISKISNFGYLLHNKLRIYVDISQALIDPFPFLELLGSGIHLVINSMDRSKLLRGLEVLYLGIERKDNKRAIALWDKQVFWAVGPLPARCNFMKYNIDRTIDFRLDKNFWKGWLLKNEQGSPHLIAIPGHYPFASDLLFSAGFRVIKMPSYSNLPLFIKSWALEEVYELLSHFFSAESLMQELKSNHWGFLASETDWDFFLRHRHFDDLQTLEVGVKPLERDIWEVDSWGTLLKLTSGGKDKTKAAVKPSEHFYIFCILVCCVIADKYPDMDRIELSILVSSTLGVPKNYSLPLHDPQQIATRRWDYYIGKAWPAYLACYRSIFR